jgi:23S rRNA pseudouridine2605 synthase
MIDSPAAAPDGERLAKVMARAGLCSRRDAEEWIKAGRVTVNGKKVLTPAFNVTTTDDVLVDGTPLAERQGTRVWLYHKPRGLVVTEKDPEGRPTIFAELAAKGLPRVLSIGRLDINTEGLLLLTNDGGLKRVLELPETGWLRKYRVRAHGAISQAQLDALREGLEVEGIKYGPIEATLEREQGSNVWIEVALREGKNREVKNVLGALGLEVNRLIRISFGPFQLGELPEGAIEAVKSRVLRDQLGERLAKAAETDFVSDMPETPVRRGGSRPAAAREGGGAGRPERRSRDFGGEGRERRPAAGASRSGGAMRPDRGPRTDRGPRPDGARGDRPRSDRPYSGRAPRTGGPRSFDRPSRFDRGPREDAPAPRIHFDDGRSVEYEDKAAARRGPPRSGGRDDAPRSRFGKPATGDRPEGGRPPRSPRGASDSRPFNRPDRDATPRPRRDDDKRPPRRGPSASGKADGASGSRAGGADRPPRSGAARPPRSGPGGRPTGGAPRGGKPGGGKPGGGGPGGGRPGAGRGRPRGE